MRRNGICGKAHRRRRPQAPDHGYGHYQGNYVRKVAPLGDPVEVNVRGYELSIRKSEAENIQVAG